MQTTYAGGRRAGRRHTGVCPPATAAEVGTMLPWLSNSVFRCAIILALGWLSLAAIVVGASGMMASEAVQSVLRPFPARVIQLDQSDPCTHDPIALSARLFVTPTARLDVDVIHTDALVLL